MSSLTRLMYNDKKTLQKYFWHSSICSQQNQPHPSSHQPSNHLDCIIIDATSSHVFFSLILPQKPSVAYFSAIDASNSPQQFRSNSERLSFLPYIELLIRISTISLSFHLHNSPSMYLQPHSFKKIIAHTLPVPGKTTTITHNNDSLLDDNSWKKSTAMKSSRNRIRFLSVVR